jgi:50S ribosomal protein L16 3-hydroxylase
LAAPLGRLTARGFLRRYWQRRPLLVRGAFPALRDPLTPRQLLDLASSAAVESRLVLARGGAHPWQLVHGPLSPRRLRRLGSRGWTVLVQEAEKHAPAVGELLRAFRFLPRWRVDDVMVSLAAPGGGVGPHVDSYDVFLVQGLGRRRWAVASAFDAALRPGLELRVLRRFRPQRSFVLRPGDMLYLPPGVAHRGVALEQSLTYSVGFRAPSRAELLVRLLERSAAAAGESQRYADRGIGVQRRAGEITAEALARFRRLLGPGLASGGDLARLVGELVTEPKGVPPEPRARRLPPRVVAQRLAAGFAIVPAPNSRLAFARDGARILLFADGQTLVLPRRLAAAAAQLTSGRAVQAAELGAHARSSAFRDALGVLAGRGALRLEPPERPRPRARPGAR